MSFKLKYLFRATFSDKTTITQNEQDVSIIDKTKSQFYDVLHVEKDIILFDLYLDGQKYVTLDLQSGEFNINGKPFNVGEEIPMPKNTKRKLIYYRQHQHEFSAFGGEELSHKIKYFLGWEVNTGGKNTKRIIGVV